MIPARSANRKNAEKNAWIIDQDRLRLRDGMDLGSIDATWTAWSTARRGKWRKLDGYRHRYDVIAGSFLGGGSLEYETLEIGKLRFEMLHRLRRIATVATASR
jgi:hypothetical protein